MFIDTHHSINSNSLYVIYKSDKDTEYETYNESETRSLFRKKIYKAT
jgi:hypothetical protein